MRDEHMQLIDHIFESLTGQLLTKIKVTKTEQSGTWTGQLPNAVVPQICWSLEPPGVLEKQFMLSFHPQLFWFHGYGYNLDMRMF